MRVMEIPPFPHQIEIADLDNFVRTRLSQTVVIWPEQAIPLLGYLCCPNDPETRAALRRVLGMWREGYRPAILRKLGRIQHRWLRVADVFHLFSDLIAGQHQGRRGGPVHSEQPLARRRHGADDLPIEWAGKSSETFSTFGPPASRRAASSDQVSAMAIWAACY
jgi:hypothetical protein